MFNSKTFRLFISSTFSDFKREREILQSKVFPHIKAYAAKQGYSFQPIDLRWGVSNEAQLDQKTLDLCLSEVKACKTYKHPNFLLMLGDRYGWVPLPYIIEVGELETLLSLMTEQEKQKIDQWYQKDLNQLPASYLLKERKESFKEYQIWEKEEVKLRNILQAAVDQSFLDKKQRRKYFISATEAEVEEGIISYINPTPSQNELLKEKPSLKETDAQHVFGFFRSVERSSQAEDAFIGKDYEKAQAFKKSVSDVVLKENMLHVVTTQLDKNTLDETYLNEFQAKTIQFLESQLDLQKQQDEKETHTSLKIELAEQSLFAENKRKNFIGQEALLEVIEDYLSDHNQQALVIHGKSGSGKSALMAKAIQEAQSSFQKKVLYRFVGATAHSSSSKNILMSMFEELEGKNTLIKTEAENFHVFSLQIGEKLQALESDTVIFIDAVDQLQNQDFFIWLPCILPVNVKIIISALDDERYRDDSEYLQALKSKTDNVHAITEFSQPEKLLGDLLKSENRTLQSNQKKYFLKQYHAEPSPLYVTIAMQQVKLWNSNVEDLDSNNQAPSLVQTQAGIVQGFIENLSKLYHHHHEFVRRVLGYIYTSKDGLSEYELLTLLSTDQEFIRKVAPDTLHKNVTKELPLVHWSRLYNTLKIFLSLKHKDNSDLLFFFHREFSQVISQEITLKEDHEAIIAATEILIVNNKNQSFASNRWGKLYVTLITEYERLYQVNDKCQAFIRFLGDTLVLENNWIEDCLYHISSISDKAYLQNEIETAFLFQSTSLRLTELLFEKNTADWKKQYVSALNLIAEIYNKEGEFKEAIYYAEKAHELALLYYPQEPFFWGEILLILCNNLNSYYTNIGLPDKMLTKLEDSLLKFKEGYLESNWSSKVFNIYGTALNTIGGSHYRSDKLIEAQQYITAAHKINEALFQFDKVIYAFTYVETLINFSKVENRRGRHDEAIELVQEAIGIAREFYEMNKNRWVGNYTNALKILSAYIYEYDQEKACVLLKLSHKILKEHYDKEPTRWMRDYTVVINNLVSCSIDAAFFYGMKELALESLKLSKVLYAKNAAIDEVKLYSSSLNNLAKFALAVDKNLDESAGYLQESYSLCKSFYGERHTDTIEVREFLNHITHLKLKPYQVTYSELIDTCLLHAERLKHAHIDVHLLNAVLESVKLNPEAAEMFTGLLKNTIPSILHQVLIDLKEDIGNEYIGTKI